MSLEIMLVVLSLTVLVVASIFDLKTREIPDYLSIGFIVSVIGIEFIYGFYENFSYLIYGLFGLGVSFILVFAFYHLKQMGGGDAKLLMGLGAAFASFKEPYYFLILLTSLIFVGGVYSFIWGIFLFVKNRKKSLPLFVKTLRKRRKYRIVLVLGAIILLVLSFFMPNITSRLLVISLLLALILSFYLSIFISVVEKVAFLKSVPIAKVTEGDWLAKDVVVEGKVVCSSKKTCLEKKDLRKFKKFKVKKVWIKYGIPFVPAIFFGVLFSLMIFYYMF